MKGIFWDPGLRNGVGDISIKSMDLLMMYWEPGVMDIQDSPHLFSLAVADNEQLKAQYPQLEGHTGSTLEVAKYIHDQSIDTSDNTRINVFSVRSRFFFASTSSFGISCRA